MTRVLMVAECEDDYCRIRDLARGITSHRYAVDWRAPPRKVWPTCSSVGTTTTARTLRDSDDRLLEVLDASSDLMHSVRADGRPAHLRQPRLA